MTLVEICLAVGLGVLIIGMIWYLLHRSVSLTDSTSKSIELQIGARSLLENLSRDINMGHRFMLPEGEAASAISSNLVVIRFKGTDAEARLHENIANTGILGALFGNTQTYPFQRSTKIFNTFTLKGTTHKTPSYRCSYSYDPRTEHVVRRREEGMLLEQNTWGCRGFLHSLKFEATEGAEVTSAVLARDVKNLQFHYLSYKARELTDPTLLENKVVTDGNLVPIEELEAKDLGLDTWPVDEAKAKMQATACVALYFKASYSKGLYGKKADGSTPAEKNRKAPEIEMLTKIWSYERMKDETEKEHFSSTDPDVRY